MGKCMFLRKGSKHEAPSVKFADSTWEQIIDACKTNTVPDTWLVGDQKTMTINGADYIVDIIGKNHDDYADGSGKAPLTFQLHDCYATSYRMFPNPKPSEVYTWMYSEMRNTSIPAILALMPSEVQAGLKEVSKTTCTGNGSSAFVYTNDKLFLLSEFEVFGEKTYAGAYYGANEGVQYDYYLAANKTIKHQDGNAVRWWLRSPCLDNNNNHCMVNESGNADIWGYGSAYGVAFAFCF